MDRTQTPSAEHLEFDRLCERVDEFDYLPDFSHTASNHQNDRSQADRQEIDQRILAGLVSPV